MKDASAGVLTDLKRFQGEKEADLKRYMVNRCFLTRCGPRLMISTARVCKGSDRLGKEESRDMGGSEERSR